MKATETHKELLAHLASLTRSMSKDCLKDFTTASLASAVAISRSLASQYLNDCVRQGLVVKAGVRPVYYFHRKSIERVLQHAVHAGSYDSVAALLNGALEPSAADFDKAVGCDLSLAPVISRLRAALQYPSNGLPVMLVGEPGTGKSLLSRLAFEYGHNTGILDPSSRLIEVDCAKYSDDSRACVEACAAAREAGGWISEAKGGVIVLSHVESLNASARDAVVSLMTAAQEGRADVERPVRFIALFDGSQVDASASALARHIPMVVGIPSLGERTAEEREELAIRFLRIEGRRLGVDVLISRSAFRALVSAPFETHVAGLKRCITNCCAEAYPRRVEDQIRLNLYQLPSVVLESVSASQDEDDSRLVNIFDMERGARSDSMTRVFQALAAAFADYEAGGVDEASWLGESRRIVGRYEDELLFGGEAGRSESISYEHLIASAIETAGEVHSAKLSKKSAVLFSRELRAQLYPAARFSAWKREHRAELDRLLAALRRKAPFAAGVTGTLASEIEKALGAVPDVSLRVLMLLNVLEQVGAEGGRPCVGVVLCHGYATATSIADAANRILRDRVFDAIDMAYDQQVDDAVRALQEILDTHSCARELAVLVDMGSLNDIYKGLAGFSALTIGIANNVSTGLAVEVGAGLLAGKGVREAIPAAIAACSAGFEIVEPRVRTEAILFVSESGMDSAERVRDLIAQSVPSELPVEMIVADFPAIVRDGEAAQAFSTYEVRAVVGTSDPHVPSVPFISLESIITGEGMDAIGSIIGRYLDSSQMMEVRRRLVKRMTLQNVIRSITILNPESLFNEVESATARLQRALGRRVAGSLAIGLYVHLCCLVERLVTRTPIEAYRDVEAFQHDHASFIEAFRESFSDIGAHYRVDVPVSEIAYVYDYLFAHRAADRADSGITQEDE